MNIMGIIVLIVMFSTVGGRGTNENYESNENDVISLWFWKPAMEDAVKQMEFEVEYIMIPWENYWSSLQVALLSGEAPDVFWMNQPGAVSYMESGLVMELTDVDMSIMETVQYSPFMLGERLYGVPIFYDAVGLFYNKDIFNEMGIRHPPSRGWTWQEMRNAALALTVIRGGETLRYGLGVYADMQVGAGNFILQNNGHVFLEDGAKPDLNNLGVLGALQFMHRLVFDDGVSPSLETNAEINMYGDLFVSEMMAMEIQGMWRVPLYYEFLGEKLGVAHLPMGEKEANTFHSVAYMAWEGTANPATVKAFMEYATTAEHGEIVASAFLPAHGGSRQEWFDKFGGLNVQIFGEVMEYAQPLQLSATNAGMVWNLLNEEIENAFKSNEPITEGTLERINNKIAQAME